MFEIEFLRWLNVPKGRYQGFLQILGRRHVQGQGRAGVVDLTSLPRRVGRRSHRGHGRG